MRKEEEKMKLGERYGVIYEELSGGVGVGEEI